MDAAPAGPPVATPDFNSKLYGAPSGPVNCAPVMVSGDCVPGTAVAGTFRVVARMGYSRLEPMSLVGETIRTRRLAPRITPTAAASPFGLLTARPRKSW